MTMTDIKKSAGDKGPAKAKKKLQINKETLKDLNATGSEKVKGGRPTGVTEQDAGCPS